MRTSNTPAASPPNLDPYLRVHRLLRTSAAQLAAALASTSTADAGRDRAVVRWYHGFSGEIRCHHHIEDELLFPALRNRVATYAEFGARLDTDHASLDVVLDGLAETLAAGNRPAAATFAAELRDHLDEHLAFEDDDVVPLFIRHFTAIEFDELNAKAVKMTSLKQLMFTAPWLMSHLDETEQAELLASVPKAMTILWKLTRGRYARMAARAFAATSVGMGPK
jgi:hypothetical protein